VSDDEASQHRVVSHLAALLEERGMPLVQLAALSGITVANLSVLKNGRARAIRFSTLTAVCDVLQCQPGDLLEVLPTAVPDVENDHSVHRPDPAGASRPVKLRG